MSTTTAIRITSPAEILGAVPVMLGFHPSDSLVVIGLSAVRRVGPIARVDLRPLTATDIHTLGAALAKHVTHAIAVVYGGRSDVSEAGLREHLGLEIVEVLWASNTPREVHPPLLEIAALSGRAVLRDRAAVRASVEHRPGTGTETTRQTVAKVATTIKGRDQFLSERMTDAPAAVVELVTAAQAVADTDPGTDELMAALAVLAYRAGDGALAQVAIDRALRINPSHCLAHLAVQAIAIGIKPEELDAIIAV